MNSPIGQEAAGQAIGSKTNLLRKMLNTCAYVYDKLSYRVTPGIDPPDEVAALAFVENVSGCYWRWPA